MRSLGVLLIAALLVFPGSSKPCENDCEGEYVSASKSSESARTASRSTDDSCEQTKSDGVTGEYSQSKAKSSSRSTAAAKDTSAESYVAYNGGGGSATSCGTTMTEDEVKKTYARKDKETDEIYFKRIVSKTSTAKTKAEYVQTILLIRKTYPDLDLWYNKKYIELIRDYYTETYSKTSTESEEQYYERIVSQETHESEDQCAGRVEVLRELWPNLSLWGDESYYERFTKRVYVALYRQKGCEDETAYFKRIVGRAAQETDTVYVNRLTLVWRTVSGLRLWYCEDTFSIVREFYSLKYARGHDECDETYVKRVTARESWETSDALYVGRIHLVHLISVGSSLWYEEKYYEYTKTYYSVYFKKGEQESCADWLTRVLTLLPGESEDLAVKRITLINKSNAGCGCWTAKNINSLECAKTLSKSYLDKITKAFIKTVSSVKSLVSNCVQGLVSIVRGGN